MTVRDARAAVAGGQSGERKVRLRCPLLPRVAFSAVARSRRDETGHERKSARQDAAAAPPKSKQGG